MKNHKWQNLVANLHRRNPRPPPPPPLTPIFGSNADITAGQIRAIKAGDWDADYNAGRITGDMLVLYLANRWS